MVRGSDSVFRSLSSGRSLADVLASAPAARPLLTRLGIDCGTAAAERSFEQVCRKQALDSDTLMRVLSVIGKEAAESEYPPVPVELMRLSELCDYLQGTAHAALQTELHRLGRLLSDVPRVEPPGESTPLARIRLHFDRFRRHLTEHLREEAEVLFPLIRQLDDSRMAETGVMDLLRMPLARMKHEHGEVDEELAALTALVADYAEMAPAHIERALKGLEKLEALLHDRIYQENQVLFRRALALLSGA